MPQVRELKKRQQKQQERERKAREKQLEKERAEKEAMLKQKVWGGGGQGAFRGGNGVRDRSHSHW